MPKPFVAAYTQPNQTEKLNKNKRRKIKKRAKKKQELLEQQVKEFSSVDLERLKDQEESLNGLKDCNLDDGEMDDDAEACGASADEESCTESASGQVRMETSKESKAKVRTANKTEGKAENKTESNRPKDSSSLANSATECAGEQLKNGKRKEPSTSKDSSKDSKANEPGSCSNVSNGDQLNGAEAASGNSCAATGPGNERTTNLNSASTELMNNFSIIFEEIKQQINTAAAESSTRKQRKPDPSREVCSVNVKIADLGNGCWVVGIGR